MLAHAWLEYDFAGRSVVGVGVLLITASVAARSWAQPCGGRGRTPWVTCRTPHR
jgi:hypothetical protein